MLWAARLATVALAIWLRTATKLLLYCPKSILNLTLPEFGIYVLDVFDCIKIVTTFSVLRWLQCLNKQCFKRRDYYSKRGFQRDFP